MYPEISVGSIQSEAQFLFSSVHYRKLGGYFPKLLEGVFASSTTNDTHPKNTLITRYEVSLYPNEAFVLGGYMTYRMHIPSVYMIKRRTKQYRRSTTAL